MVAAAAELGSSAGLAVTPAAACRLRFIVGNSPSPRGVSDDVPPWPRAGSDRRGPAPLSAREPPPQPANPRDARILVQIEFPAVTVVVKRGRTVVYESFRAERRQAPAPRRPADDQTGRPAQASSAERMARQEGKPGQAQAFDRTEVEALVKALRAGGNSAPLKTEPVHERWLIPGLIPWPHAAWGVARGPDFIAVWAGAFDYEVLFEVRLSGHGRARPQPRNGE